MKKLFLISVFLLFVSVASAQAVNVTFQWDPSPDAATAPADNPVKYKIYKCTDALATQCLAGMDVGTALTTVQPLVAGTTYWYATAYWNTVMGDGVPAGTSESAKSNILKVVVTIPPGNPKNYKIRTSSLGSIPGSKDTLFAMVR